MTRKLIGYRVRQADGEWAAGASGLPLVFTTPERRIAHKGEAVVPYYVRPSTSKRLAKAEADVAHLLDRAEKAEAEVRRYQSALANEEAVAKGHNDRLAAVNADLDKCRAELAEAEAELTALRAALIRAHCGLRNMAGLSGIGSIALRENELVGFTNEWELAHWHDDASSAPSATKEPR